MKHKTPKKNNRKVNWSMLISHHPPSQYDRTFMILGLRLCVRCTFMTIGISSTVVLLLVTKLHFNTLFLCGIIFFTTLPAVLNFTLHELKRHKSNNHKRAITGFLLGIPLGLASTFLLDRQFGIGILILGWYLLLEILVIKTLMRSNVIDSYIKEYEEGVYKKKNEIPPSHPIN